MAERSRTDWDWVIALAGAAAYAAEQKGLAIGVDLPRERVDAWQAIVDEKMAELRHIAAVHVAYEQKRS